MIKLFACTILSIWIISSAQAQDLYRIERNNLFGYIDANGNEVIKCQYKFSFTYTLRHVAFVVKSDKIIGINKNNKRLFAVFNYDNGPDYVKEGLFRIIDSDGLVGFADTLGNVIIKPQYKFAFPFDKGKAKVTYEGNLVKGVSEYSYWKSEKWVYIANPNNLKR